MITHILQSVFKMKGQSQSYMFSVHFSEIESNIIFVYILNRHTTYLSYHFTGVTRSVHVHVRVRVNMHVCLMHVFVG